MLLPSRSTLLTHHAKLISSLWKQRSRNARSGDPRTDAVHVVDAPDRPRLHGRVQVRELPLVGGDLSGRVLELLEEQEPELLLGEAAVHEGEGHAVEGEVPRREPRVLPLVRHRHDAHRVQVPPVDVADVLARGGRRPSRVVPAQPVVDVEQVDLLRPEERSEGLPLDELLVGARRLGLDRRVELVGLRLPPVHDRVHVRERIRQALRGEAQADHPGASGRHDGTVVHAGLGPQLVRAHAVFAVHEVAVERILHVGTPAPGLGTKDARSVRLVVREERPASLGGVEVSRPQAVGELQPADRRSRPLVRHEGEDARSRVPHPDVRLCARLPRPRPRVAEPEVGEEAERRRLRAPVPHGDPYRDVLDVGLGVLDEDVEVPVVVEDAGIQELELRAAPFPPPVLLDELPVGVLALGVLVERLHVGVGRRVVEVEVVLLDVLPTVPLARDEPEEALLQDGIALVPEGEGEDEDLIAVRDPEEAVLAPAEGLAAGQIVGEVPPGVPVRAVVLPDRTPGPIGHVGPPASPSRPVVGDGPEPLVLARRRHLIDP